MAIQVEFDRMLKVYFKILHNYCLSVFDINHKGINNFYIVFAFRPLLANLFFFLNDLISFFLQYVELSGNDFNTHPRLFPSLFVSHPLLNVGLSFRVNNLATTVPFACIFCVKYIARTQNVLVRYAPIP